MLVCSSSVKNSEMTQQPKILLYFLLLRLLPEYLFIKRYIFLFLGSLYFLIPQIAKKIFLRSLYFPFPQIAIFLYFSDCYIFFFLRLPSVLLLRPWPFKITAATHRGKMHLPGFCILLQLCICFCTCICICICVRFCILDHS